MKMKKVLAIGLSLAMLLGLAACGSPDSGEPSTSGTNTEPATEVSTRSRLYTGLPKSTSTGRPYSSPPIRTLLSSRDSEYAPMVSSDIYSVSEGCDVVKEDGTVDVDGEAGRKVLERLASWYQNGYTSRDSEYAPMVSSDIYSVMGESTP